MFDRNKREYPRTGGILKGGINLEAMDDPSSRLGFRTCWTGYSYSPLDSGEKFARLLWARAHPLSTGRGLWEGNSSLRLANKAFHWVAGRMRVVDRLPRASTFVGRTTSPEPIGWETACWGVDAIHPKSACGEYC